MLTNILARVVMDIAHKGLFIALVALSIMSSSGVARADLAVPTPEISIGAAGGAMTLLTGGLLLIRERIRSRR